MDKKPHYGIFRTKEQMEDYKASKLKHEQRMETDPEYRERYEKTKAYLMQLFPPNSGED